MPDGKPAGVRCVQLADDNRCKIFGQPERPAFAVACTFRGHVRQQPRTCQ